MAYQRLTRELIQERSRFAALAWVLGIVALLVLALRGFGQHSPFVRSYCETLSTRDRLQKYGDASLDLPVQELISDGPGGALFAQALHFCYAFNRAEALISLQLAKGFTINHGILLWAETYAMGPFLNRVEHSSNPGYPAYLPTDHGKIAVVAEAAVTAAQNHLEKVAATVSMTDTTLHAKAVDAAQLQLHLATAAADRFDPAILSAGTEGFEARFRKAQIRYAEALESLGMQHQSADLLAMSAEAYMVPDAWAVDEDNKIASRQLATHARQLLCLALELNPHQPLALHMQIHVSEQGNPTRPGGETSLWTNCTPSAELFVAEGESTADILAFERGPWSEYGHLVHMAAHTFTNLGRYNDAVSAGLRALELDARDAEACQATIASEHSMDVTIYAANMAGQSQLAINASTELRSFATKFPTGGWLEGSPSFDWTALPLTWIFHGMWWEILKSLEPPPNNARGICARQGFEYATGVYHYAMALALAARGETAAYGKLPGAGDSLRQAEGHLQKLKAIAGQLQPDGRTRPGAGGGLYGCEYQQLAEIQVEVASARIAQATGPFPGDVAAAATHLERAVQLEGSLSYAEPPRQHQPLRHCQAHVFERLLEPQSAEHVSREALKLRPDNSWALYALRGSLEKQDRPSDEVAAVAAALDTAWQRADRPINCPCPIFVVF